MTGAEKREVTAKNLRLLAEYLEDKRVIMRYFFYQADDRGSLEEFNDRRAYRLRNGVEVERTPHWCGTCACALGWATTHPEMPPLPEHFNGSDCFYIFYYENTYFPAVGTFSKVFSDSLPDEGAAQRCIDWAEILERQ